MYDFQNLDSVELSYGASKQMTDQVHHSPNSLSQYKFML